MQDAQATESFSIHFFLTISYSGNFYSSHSTFFASLDDSFSHKFLKLQINHPRRRNKFLQMLRFLLKSYFARVIQLAYLLLLWKLIKIAETFIKLVSATSLSHKQKLDLIILPNLFEQSKQTSDPLFHWLSQLQCVSFVRVVHSAFDSHFGSVVFRSCSLVTSSWHVQLETFLIIHSDEFLAVFASCGGVLREFECRIRQQRRSPHSIFNATLLDVVRCFHKYFLRWIFPVSAMAARPTASRPRNWKIYSACLQ